MSLDQTLRNKLKNMPRIEPRTSRETFRRQVLAEVEKRERNPRKPRKLLLPAAFAGAVALFMFVILSPWIMQKASDNGIEIGRSESEFGTLSEKATDKSTPEPEGKESAVPPADDADESQPQEDNGKASTNEGDPAQNAEAGEEPKTHDPAPEGESGSGDPSEFGIAMAPSIEPKGQVTREISLEGMQEKAVFDRYVFQPYGLQILIPVMSGGDKWFGEPQIDGGASQAVVFPSNSQTMENGELLLSSITVTAYGDKSPAEVKQDEIATEEEEAGKNGYTGKYREEILPNGERLMFDRTLQGKDRTYTYIREVFITEQNGQTFAFHIGRNQVTNEGVGARLSEVVYPEFKVVE